jgi:hypothetical protein
MLSWNERSRSGAKNRSPEIPRGIALCVTRYCLDPRAERSINRDEVPRIAALMTALE